MIESKYLFRTFNILVIIIPFFVFCTKPNSVALAKYHNTLQDRRVRTSNLVGSFAISYKGERMKGNIAIMLEPQFCATIFGPFGNRVAKITTRDSAIDIEYGEYFFSGDTSDMISSFNIFKDYPFRFSELIRIMSGEGIFMEKTVSEPDTCSHIKRRYVCEWETDLCNIQVVYKNRVDTPNMIIYDPPDCKLSWQLTLSKFKDSFWHEIYFRSNNMNYFKILF